MDHKLEHQTPPYLWELVDNNNNALLMSSATVIVRSGVFFEACCDGVVYVV